MIYTELTKKALRIAFNAHKDQVDNAGTPYIFHPFHLAEQMDTEEEICVALLHDVVKCSGITPDDLRDEGFSFCIIDAISFLMHDPDTEYMDYIQAVKFNAIAAKVKLADLRHNSDSTRLLAVDAETARRIEKYKEAIELLVSPKHLENHSCGALGETKYFKTEYSAIIKVEDGVSVYLLSDNGKFNPFQNMISLFIWDDMTGYMPMSEADVLKEAEYRKRSLWLKHDAGI